MSFGETDADFTEPWLEPELPTEEQVNDWNIHNDHAQGNEEPPEDDQARWYDGLRLRVKGYGEPYDLGPICELEDAIGAEARTIAADAGSNEINDPSEETRAAYAARIIVEATMALRHPDDSYRDPTGKLWVLERPSDG